MSAATSRWTTIRPVWARLSSPQYVAVTSLRSASATGHPRCHDVPTIRRTSALESLAAVKLGETASAPPTTARPATTTASVATRLIKESGWSDSNRRNLPAPNRALYQAELHPDGETFSPHDSLHTRDRTWRSLRGSASCCVSC